ncbi:TetR/AcrR family transcriptional regulator C-terminal domain-containing protein [Actinocrispum wychmicini]|uniref:TetR family transcriptional regulator n=1 Tax=Actinocrispum wychmicini TaxID=1213861 RepID=A0A4R2IVN0_9PSEU|nr:TetR/AcrR family transcriptional regulator C-terminal domain-containing protein [Actinocrispum wychmicini]TCO48782.1 TetR family transcriptional regulator [Actinocrispum wychmicini]
MPEPEPRVPLTRDRVLHAAVALADNQGLGSVTMRRLAEAVGAEAMSLYYHVANKEDVLDGLTTVIAREINDTVDKLDLPAHGANWKNAVRHRILSAREVLLRHPWAPSVFETRTTTSPEVLKYYDGLLALMRAGGFSYDLAHHALHALGSRALGFTQELFDPSTGPTTPEETAAILANLADNLPHLAAMMADIVHNDPTSTLGWCDDKAEFEFGLDLILNGLDGLRDSF